MEFKYILKEQDFETYNSIKNSIDFILKERLKEFIEQEQYRPGIDNLCRTYLLAVIDKETFYCSKEGCCLVLEWKSYDGSHSEALHLPMEMFTLDDEKWKVFLFKLQMKISQEVRNLQKEIIRLDGVIESKRLKDIEEQELSTLRELQEKYKDKL